MLLPTPRTGEGAFVEWMEVGAAISVQSQIYLKIIKNENVGAFICPRGCSLPKPGGSFYSYGLEMHLPFGWVSEPRDEPGMEI